MADNNKRPVPPKKSPGKAKVGEVPGEPPPRLRDDLGLWALILVPAIIFTFGLSWVADLEMFSGPESSSLIIGSVLFLIIALTVGVLVVGSRRNRE